MVQTDSSAERDFKTGKEQLLAEEMAWETLPRNFCYVQGHPEGRCLWKEGSLLYNMSLSFDQLAAV